MQRMIKIYDEELMSQLDLTRVVDEANKTCLKGNCNLGSKLG